MSASIHTAGARTVIRIEFNKLSGDDKRELLKQLAADTPNEYNPEDRYVALTHTYLGNMVSNYEQAKELDISAGYAHLNSYIVRCLKDKE